MERPEGPAPPVAERPNKDRGLRQRILGRFLDSGPRASVVRRGLLWWFDHPADPYLVVNFSLDVTAARAYLVELNRGGDQPRVTIQHLVTAAVAATLRVWPMANAQIHGRRIIPREHVGIAVPVNLLGTEVGARRELSATILREAEGNTLREMAAISGRSFAAEREDRVENPFFRELMRGFERLPDPVMGLLLDSLDRGRRLRWISELLFQSAPVTTGITNPGAGFQSLEGLHFKGAALSLPHRLFHIGTLWAIMPIQDEVVAWRGEPTIRPMLPVMLLFDHRLLDGVLGGRLVSTFSSFLLNPKAAFGSDGHGKPPKVVHKTRPRAGD